MKRDKKTEQPERDKQGRRLHADKPKADGHYMGKRCGFDYKDGRYRVAPSHYSIMDKAAEEESAIRAMMNAQNAYIGEQFRRIQGMRLRFWEGIRDDYDLGQENLVYHGDGWISYQPDEDKVWSCAWCGLNGFKKLSEVVAHHCKCEKYQADLKGIHDAAS